MEFFQKLFDTSDFVPRWACGAWSTGLAWTHMIADFVIFISYAAIPAALAVIVIRRRDMPHALIWLLFVSFIISCGLTHLVESLMFYEPLYRLSALMKVITAAVSAVTAVALAGVLPSIMSLPRLKLENEELSSELSRERIMAKDLADARAQLEERSAQNTARSRRFSAALAAAGAVACRWEASADIFEWQIGLADALRAIGAPTGERTPKSFAGLLGEEHAARLRAAAQEAVATGGRIDFSAPVIVARDYFFRIAAEPEPEVAGQSRWIIGMFRFTPVP